MKLKVCGLSKPIEVETCVNNNVSFCGFILNFSKSHRYISYEKANNLLNIYKNKTQYVGVLVRPSLNELEKFSKLNLDYFQLYGQYDNRSLIDIKNKNDIETYKKVAEGSDIILWDSTGYEKSLGWNHGWVKDIKINGKKMIAGDITIDKLKKLSKFADIIDVSGALETNKVKDIKKIKEFITHLNKINNEN